MESKNEHHCLLFEEEKTEWEWWGSVWSKELIRFSWMFNLYIVMNGEPIKANNILLHTSQMSLKYSLNNYKKNSYSNN